MTPKQEEVTIEKPAYGGYGLGFIDGKAVLVSRAVPGDRVSFWVTREKGDYILADIKEILEPAPSRVDPACENFGVCGGCCYLNIPYQEELSFKGIILGESLCRIGRLNKSEIPEIEIRSADRHCYRSHALVKVQDEKRGFYRQETNDLVPFPPAGCLLLDRRISRYLAHDRRSLDSKEFRIAVSEDSRVITSFGSDPAVTERAGGLVFRRHVNTFFQVNSFLREDMLRVVGEYAGLGGVERVLDIGCGVGFFTIFLAGSARLITGVDINRENIKWARANAELNGTTNVRFLRIPAAEINPGRLDGIDVIVVDPPRAGLSRRDRNTITSIGAERIVYVSCDPATFSRDVADLRKKGYRLSRLVLIDMFPATHHIEVVSLLQLPVESGG